MPLPDFSPSPSTPSPSSSFGFLYLPAVFILLLFILICLYVADIFNKRVDRPNDGELSENVEAEAPIFSYDEIHNEKECVICLCGIEEGEKCRRMNTCGHVFHKDCIDEWFMVEHHCPLCRNVICVVVDGNTTDSSSSITFDKNHCSFVGTIW